MEKIVIYRSFSKQYIRLKCKVKKNKILRDYLKIFVILIIFFISLFIYGYFVNVGSTKGYFLRKEMEKLENIKLMYNVVKLDILKKESNLIDNINLNNISYKVIQIDCSKIDSKKD